MNSLQKIGGISSLLAAATFVVGLAMFATMLIDYTTADDAGVAVAFLVDNQLVLFIWNLIITILFGIVLVPLVLALHGRLKDAAPVLAPIAAVFGFIWAGLILATGMIANIGYGTVSDLHGTDPAAAETVWTSIETVTNGLGGGNEVVGGVWVLVLSLAAIRTRAFPKWLGSLGMVAGVAGLVTVVPPLEDLGAVFGIGLVIWFVAVGLQLLQQGRLPVDATRQTVAIGR